MHGLPVRELEANYLIRGKGAAAGAQRRTDRIPRRYGRTRRLNTLLIGVPVVEKAKTRMR